MTNEMNVNTENGMMNIRVVDITPEFAEELLKLNTFNRPPKKNKVNMYASELANNRWKANGVPIVIGSDNILKDGQHRLLACIKANKPLKDMVIIRLPKDNCTCYDIGVARTTSDTAILMGVSSPIIKNHLALSILRAAILMEYSSGRSELSKITLIDEAKRNESALSFVLGHAKKQNKLKGLSIAPVWAAILNAYLSGYSYDKLENFCEVLTSGMTVDEADFPIIKLRNYLLSTAGQSGQGANKEKFIKTQNALYAYERGNKTCKNCDIIYHYTKNYDQLKKLCSAK
jgi:hypothetical protein